ncbi:oxidoreductase [Demequina gelatinilytica]|uniref:oxidoreductase n=1 Tax=Demequina gelatinilytica TaxID=1638980 RepID=UPI000A5F81BC|nr:oxidoreductase [Demequina gelatinilytica]
MPLVILITGASSGMGREAALRLAADGHTVYAAARRTDLLEALRPHGIVPLELDVTSDEDCTRAVATVLDESGRIDVLVNNAGYGLYGPVEEVPLEEARRQFDVNLFGLARLTQLVLPHMRERGTGRIVNISSMGGRIYTPMGAWYHASKHALEGWSDCLRYELAPFGIDVVVVEPGSVRSEWGPRMSGRLADFADGPYRAMVASMVASGGDGRDRATPAAVLGEVFAEAATAPRPRRRYVKGYLARPAMAVRRWLGDGVYEAMVRRLAS